MKTDTGSKTDRKGRPWHTWKDGIIKMGQEKGPSCKEMRVLAKDREK
jgi:hypothetical protein